MPVDDQEGRSEETRPADGSSPREAPHDERAAAPPPPRAPRRGLFRRYVTRRNAVLTGVALVAGIVLLVLVGFLLYRTGQVDHLIERQIKSTLAEYGIRADIRGFRARLGPRTAELTGVDLYDSQTGEKLGHVDRILATVRVEDMWALSLRRNVNLEELNIDGLELWVKFDEQGRSNFRNIHLPPPRENERITFSYSTAHVTLTRSVVHYGDAQHELSGEARDLNVTVDPDNPGAPAASAMNRVHLSLDNSTLTYDGRPALNDISIDLRARVDQTQAQIEDLTLRSPVAEAHLTGAMPDWRSLRYDMQVKSSVDLTQLSATFQTPTPIRGAGSFEGRVTGEGDKFQVEGQINSDALAASNIRLKNLTVNAKGTGDSDGNYNAQGTAVAEALTAGDFVLNAVQVRGGVMGTGTDFKFLGDLRAAAARSGENSIMNLILSDAVAEYRDGQLDATAKGASVGTLRTSAAQIAGLQTSGLRLKLKDARNFDASTGRVSTGSITAKDTKLKGVTAPGVTAAARDGVTKVETNDVHIGGGEIAGAQVGDINIAGVRLAIYENGRVEGSTSDINAGTVAFKSGNNGGRVENVKLARPAFVVEPSGRYRASADLSLGGGVLGTIPLGAAHAAVVATSNEIQLNDFTAEALRGRARGNAVINTAKGPSRVKANFEGLDVGGLIALLTGREQSAIAVAGAATGSVDLTFPGTNFQLASGTLTTQLAGETGDEIRGRTPVNGEVSLRADRGLFQIERANLQAGASHVDATGRFSFEGDSDLQVNLVSTDAAELERVVVGSNLAPSVEGALHDYGVDLAGRLEFNGTVRGALADPIVSGHASLASLIVNGHDLGSLAATLDSDTTATRITDGRLTDRAGGSAQFSAEIPRAGKDNVSLQATLDRLDIGTILAAVPQLLPSEESATNASTELAAVGPTSGKISVTGLPGAMSGSADLRAGPGQLRGEPFDSITARATFSGKDVNVEALDARFRSGELTASGRVNIENKSFDLNAKGTGVKLDVVQSLFGAGAGLPNVGGTFDFTAKASGVYGESRTYNVTLDGTGHNVTINGQQAGTLALTGRTENNRITLQLSTGILGGTQPQVITAEVDLSNENLPTTIRTSLTGVDLTQLFAALMPGASVKASGHATGTLEAAGNIFDRNEGFNFGALHGTATFTDFAISIEDVQLTAENPLVVQFTPNEITFERTRFTGPSTNLVFGGTAALAAGGRQNFTVNGDLNLRVLNGLSRNNFFTGVARLEARVAGTFEQPRVTGLVTVADASAQTLLLGNERLPAQNINGTIRFTADRAEIESLTGTLGGGRFNVTGGALLAGFTPSQYRLNVHAEQITVPFPQDFRSTADADLAVQNSTRGTFISGNVNLRRTEYTKNIQLTDFLDRRQQATISEGGGAAEGGIGSNVQLDLNVEGRDALVVRNNVADAVGSVALQIRGPAEEPVISGRVNITRGTINFIRGQRYELTRAIIDLPPQQQLDPVFNVQAESEIKGYRTIVQLTGPLSQLSANVRSEPALPQADVVSLITRGELASDTSSQTTLAQTGVGTAASLLTETLINQPVQRATNKLFGLNRFEIDPLIAGSGGASPTARITVGRQVSRDLSITYSTNVTSDPNQVIAVEYRLSDRLSFVAQYQQGPVNTLRAQRDNFSFEVRFRKRF